MKTKILQTEILMPCFGLLLLFQTWDFTIPTKHCFKSVIHNL